MLTCCKYPRHMDESLILLNPPATPLHSLCNTPFVIRLIPPCGLQESKGLFAGETLDTNYMHFIPILGLMYV